MISTHGYVAAEPPLGAPDTGGQVVFVLELSRKLAQLGYRVDIWTRRFEKQRQIEVVDDDVRIIRMPCGGPDFIPKEYLYKKLPEWGENALRFIQRQGSELRVHQQPLLGCRAGRAALGEGARRPARPHPALAGVCGRSDQMERTPTRARPRRWSSSTTSAAASTTSRRCTASATGDRHVAAAGRPAARTATTSRPRRLRMIPPGYDDNRFFPVSEATRTASGTSSGTRGWSSPPSDGWRATRASTCWSTRSASWPSGCPRRGCGSPAGWSPPTTATTRSSTRSWTRSAGTASRTGCS